MKSRCGITLLLLVLYVATLDAAVVCSEYEYTIGGSNNIMQADYYGHPYQFAHLKWMVDPPIDIEVGSGAARISYKDFVLSYPWATEELMRYSSLRRFSLSTVKLAAPGESPGCAAWIDAINMYWDSVPVQRLFTMYPVRCDYDGHLMFAVDPAAHPIKDAWGSKPRWPTDGQHFAPHFGRTSFETMIAGINHEKRETIAFALAYHSKAVPHLSKLVARTCVDIDITGLANALLKRYNETVHQPNMAKRGAAPPEVDGEVPNVPKFESEADKDKWTIDQLRKAGVLVDLPLEGKRAPPTRPPSTIPPSPYDGNEVDADAIIHPDEQLGQPNEEARVLGAQDAELIMLDGLLWPVLECIKDVGDGTCIAFFAYHLASDTAVDVPVEATESNWFDPQEFLTDFDRDQPTHFEPGYHTKAFVIRWVCDKLSQFQEIHWTLKGSTASATLLSPTCGAAEEDDSLIQEAHNNVEKARSSKNIRKLFSIEENGDEEARRKRQDTADSSSADTSSTTFAQITTTADAAASSSSSSSTGGSSTTGASPTTPPPTTIDDEFNCTDGHSCDGVLQPRLECTHNFENGTCVSYFGYLNLDTEEVNRPPGFASNNFFTPIDDDQGQPGNFLPGRQYYVVTVYWACQHSSGVPGSISWVMNTTATASSATHNTCPVGCDDIPFSNATDCPTTESSSELVSTMSSGIAISSSSSMTIGTTEPPSTSSSSSSTGGSSSAMAASSSTGIIPTPCPPPPACQYGATLDLYRNRNFTMPYKPPKVPPHSLCGNSQPYGVVKLEVPNDWLGDFCLDVTEVVECLCNDSLPCHPFDPTHPGITGCNSPGVLKRILYRESPAVANDGFAFVENPPTYCSGKRAFTWTQQMVAPPGHKLLVQSKWSYTALHGGQHNCSGNSQGGSGAVYNCCSCPNTHTWNYGCGCCMPIVITGGNVNVNVSIINVINITIPDQSATGVTAIAAATASVAVATATAAATSTTGNIVIVIDHNKPHWSVWLLIGLASAIALPCLIIGALLLGLLGGAATQAEQDPEFVFVEEPQPTISDEIAIIQQQSISARPFVPAPLAARHHLDIGTDYHLVNGELVEKHN